MLSYLKLFLTLLGCFYLIASPAVGAPETGAQEAVRERRNALTAALNRHDIQAVRTFYHPQFKGHDLDGEDRGYEAMMDTYERAFARNPDITLTLKIEKIEVSGGLARVTSMQQTDYTRPDGSPGTRQARLVEIWKPVGGKWVMTKYREIRAGK